VKTALQFLLAFAALAAPFGLSRAADTPPAEDPIAVLLREREALTGEQVEVTPDVFTGQLKVTVDISGKAHGEALRLVNTALRNSGIEWVQIDDIKHAWRLGANPYKSAPHLETKVSRLSMSNAPIDRVINDLLNLTGRTIVISLDLLNGPGLNVEATNVTQSHAAEFLRDALRQEAGLLLDETPDNGFQARRDETFKPNNRSIGVMCLQNASAETILGALHTLNTNVILLPYPEANQRLVSVECSYRTKPEAEKTLRTALASQAGIVVNQQSDGSWEVRQSGRNEYIAAPAPAAPKS